MMFAIFVLMLATFVVSFAFVAFFVVFATFVIAFAFVLAFFAAFVLAFAFAFMLWHVGFHFLHFLCHSDEFCSLIFIEVFPVGESFNHSVHASHHFRAWSLLVVALMMLVALLFLVFAVVFASFVVFLLVAA